MPNNFGGFIDHEKSMQKSLASIYTDLKDRKQCFKKKEENKSKEQKKRPKKIKVKDTVVKTYFHRACHLQEK